jgi:hypothetical protein
MRNLREPTKKEKLQLNRYVQELNDWDFHLAAYDIALWFVAVCELYHMCGHRGKTMVAIDTEGTTHLFAWTRKGRFYPITRKESKRVAMKCSGCGSEKFKITTWEALTSETVKRDNITVVSCAACHTEIFDY